MLDMLMNKKSRNAEAKTPHEIEMEALRDALALPAVPNKLKVADEISRTARERFREKRGARHAADVGYAYKNIDKTEYGQAVAEELQADEKNKQAATSRAALREAVSRAFADQLAPGVDELRACLYRHLAEMEEAINVARDTMEEAQRHGLTAPRVITEADNLNDKIHVMRRILNGYT